MDSNTFKLLRESINLEQQVMADALDVSLRSVQRWDRSMEPIPAAVEFLLDMVQRYEEFLEQELEAVDSAPDDSTIVLTCYRNRASFDRATGGKSPLPWTVYERAIQQVALYAHMDGRPFVVEYVHEEK